MGSIYESIQAAIAELLLKPWVLTAEWDQSYSEDKPGGYVRKRVQVLHKINGLDSTYTNKDLYINKNDYSWVWHYGGPQFEPASTPFRTMVQSKLDAVKTTMGLDHIEIVSVDETVPSGVVQAVKTNTGNNADTYTIKVWKTGETTIGYKIIGKTTVS